MSVINIWDISNKQIWVNQISNNKKGQLILQMCIRKNNLTESIPETKQNVIHWEIFAQR